MNVATIFRCMAASPAWKALSGSLQVLACLVAILLAPPPALSSPATGILYLPELCRLSVEELLLVRVIDPAAHSAPGMPLIDLELEELLTIKALRLTYNGRSTGAIEDLQTTQRIERGLKEQQ